MSFSDKSGKTFVAYKGNEINKDEIVKKLQQDNNITHYTVKKITNGNVLFAKLVYDSYIEDRDPYKQNNIMTVSWYDQDQISHVNSNTYLVSDADRYHLVIYYSYKDNGTEMFKKLSSMNFCSVIYDKKTDEIIAGVTEPNNNFVHLYYGYTPQNRELMYSNDQDLLNYFCSEVHEMEKNTYMKDGITYTLDGEQISQPKGNINLISLDRKNADVLLGGLNALLLQITDEVIRNKVENNITDYLNSEDPKKRIEDYLVKELDKET